MKNIPLTLWLEIAHVTSQQESWVGKFNKYHKKNCTLPDTMRLCKADDFCDHPGHYPSPQCLLIYWADLYDSPLDSEASNCILSPPSDATLLYIFPLLSQLYTIPLTMHGYWPLPPIIGCYWGVSSQSQKHLRLAMATIRLETTSNFAWSPNTFNTAHMGRKGYKHSYLLFITVRWSRN